MAAAMKKAEIKLVKLITIQSVQENLQKRFFKFDMQVIHFEIIDHFRDRTNLFRKLN